MISADLLISGPITVLAILVLHIPLIRGRAQVWFYRSRHPLGTTVTVMGIAASYPSANGKPNCCINPRISRASGSRCGVLLWRHPLAGQSTLLLLQVSRTGDNLWPFVQGNLAGEIR
jgi:hypothetical protein